MESVQRTLIIVSVSLPVYPGHHKVRWLHNFSRCAHSHDYHPQLSHWSLLMGFTKKLCWYGPGFIGNLGIIPTWIQMRDINSWDGTQDDEESEVTNLLHPESRVDDQLTTTSQMLYYNKNDPRFRNNHFPQTAQVSKLLVLHGLCGSKSVESRWSPAPAVQVWPSGNASLSLWTPWSCRPNCIISRCAMPSLGARKGRGGRRGGDDGSICSGARWRCLELAKWKKCKKNADSGWCMLMFCLFLKI